jgi:hypothetical protein
MMWVLIRAVGMGMTQHNAGAGNVMKALWFMVS